MKKGLGLSFFVIMSILVVGCATTNNPQGKKEVSMTSSDFPQGYQDWANTFSKVVPEKGEFHRVLVAPESISAYKSGGDYKDGDKLVLEFSKLENKEGSLIKGKPTLVTLMVRDGSSATGGWRFLAFDGDYKKADTASCYTCHLVMGKDNNLVCSKYEK